MSNNKSFALVGLCLPIFLSHSATAHSGRTDSYGCHNNNSTGRYECHSGPFAGQVFTSKEAMLAKLNSSSSGSTTTPSTGGSTTTPSTGGNSTTPSTGGSTTTPSTGGSTTTPSIPLYSRDEYLPDWDDVDGDCQNTRHEVLIAESLSPVTLSANGCTVVAGRWYDPYTGSYFTNPADLDIDHVVALSEAHKSGAHAWPISLKRSYANDLSNPLVLIAVDDGTNQAKGDKDPASWLPPNVSYHCDYVKAWVAIKDAYDLSIDAAEQAAISRILPAFNGATRTEAQGSWAHRIQREAGAGFNVGMEKAGSCGFQSSASVRDVVKISVEINPAPEHIGQTGNLYLVDRVNGSFTMEKPDGTFVPWNGWVNTLEPLKQGVAITRSIEIEMFAGTLSVPGEHKIFVGYSTEDGELIYTPVAVPLSVLP